MRLIDADALKVLICEHVYPVQDAFNSQGYGMFWTGGIEKAIDEMPTADVQEVRYGKWIHDGYDFPQGCDWVHCSNCGQRGINVPADLTKYCPNCGARMK